MRVPGRIETKDLVRPIFKKGDKIFCSNYRPITIISTISKIFERIMCTRLNSLLLNQKHFLSLIEYAFQNKNQQIKPHLIKFNIKYCKFHQPKNKKNKKPLLPYQFLDIKKALFGDVNHFYILL